MMQGDKTKTKGNSQSTLNFIAVYLNKGNSPQSPEIYKVGKVGKIYIWCTSLKGI